MLGPRQETNFVLVALILRVGLARSVADRGD